jgi:serine/threonine protein phosphatase 1
LRWGLLSSPAKKRAKPRTPIGERIYAVGDIHGRADLLAALFARIDDDLSARPIGDTVQVFLGDYIDRGPDSRRVLDLLIDRQRQHKVVCLKGNHELYAVQALSEPSVLPEWLKMGGIATLLSYGVRPPTRDDDAQAQREAVAAFRRALPDSHHHFLLHLAPSFSYGDYFFAHAGVRPEVPLQQQYERDLLWIRDDFLLHEEDFGKVVVHGHTPAPEPDIRPNRINIDTGAYATGRLTCLVLENDQMRFL